MGIECVWMSFRLLPMQMAMVMVMFMVMGTRMDMGMDTGMTPLRWPQPLLHL